MEEESHITENISEVAQPETEEVEETNKLEKAPEPGAKPKRARSQKQIESFERARKALAEKQARQKEEREKSKRPVGRPKKGTEKPKPRVVFQEPSDSSESEPEIIHVKNKKKKRKQKKPARVIYVSDSSDSSDSDYEPEPTHRHRQYQQQQQTLPPDPFDGLRWV